MNCIIHCQSENKGCDSHGDKFQGNFGKTHYGTVNQHGEYVRKHSHQSQFNAAETNNHQKSDKYECNTDRVYQAPGDVLIHQGHLIGRPA